MPRYPEWFKRAGDFVPAPAALNVGKKLLGYIATRRETPGVDTLVRRVKLSDGTVVEASFHGDQPRVIVYPPDGEQAACELYVESGMLDLGPNIAPDANKRFNRGPPEFDDRQATLYFGDGVDCRQGEPGLNGKVRVDIGAKTLKSECLPKHGRSVESRLRDPAKKKAQAMLPASCWSGLMQRYVQAVYGGDSLDYSVSGDVLFVEGMRVGGIGMSVGLVNLDGALRFVYAGSGPVYTAKVRFKTKCGEAVYRMWKQVRGRAPAAEADKILTIALSEAYPGDVMTQIGDTGDLRFVSSYGWQFDTNTPEAYAVTANDSHATVKKLAFTSGEDGLSAAVSDFETAELPPLMISCWVSSPNAPTTRMFATDSESRGGAARGSKYEHPIACYFEDGLVVVRYIYDNSLGNDVAVVDGTECGAGYSHEQRFNIAIPGETGYNYRLSIIQDQAPFFPADFSTNYGYQHAGNAVTGLFAKRGGTVLWSTVENTPVLYMKTISSLSPHAEYVGGTWVFSATFHEYIQAGTRTTAYSELDRNNGVPNLIGFSGVNHPAAYASADPLCGRKWDGYFQNCGEWRAPPITDECAEGQKSHYSMTWTVELPISKHVEREVSAFIIAGAQHEVAHQRGDCAAIAGARVNRKGCYPRLGLDADAANHASHKVKTTTHYSGGHIYYPPIAPDSVGCFSAGSVVGEITLTCDGTLKQSVPFSGGSADHLSVCTTCWVPGEPRTEAVEVAAFMQASTRLIFGGLTHEKSGGLKLFGDAGTNTFIEDWAFASGTPFEFLIESDYGTFIREHCTSDFDNAPTVVASADGDTSIEKLMLNELPLMQQGFDYVARRSMLNAKTQWNDPFTFGTSVNMDRETITGGYPKVSTPSFVGWA